VAAWRLGITSCNIAEFLTGSLKTSPCRAPARTPFWSSTFSRHSPSTPFPAGHLSPTGAHHGLVRTRQKGKRPSFLFKLKLTSNVKRAITAVPWDDWQGKSNEGFVEVVELRLKLQGWSCERRVIVERTLKPLNPSPQSSFWKPFEEDFNAYVTNLTPEEADAFQVIQLNRQRRMPNGAERHGQERSDVPAGCDRRGASKRLW
jgi:hypothetical protein